MFCSQLCLAVPSIAHVSDNSKRWMPRIADISGLIKPSDQPGPAYVFRAHLDGSAAGFVAWDRQDPITPGAPHTLRWLTGAPDAQTFVALELWTASDGWQPVEGGARVANSGRFHWVPPALEAPPLMRVRVLGESGVEHVSQMMLSNQ